jgi:para-nitrobenzyl esterase
MTSTPTTRPTVRLATGVVSGAAVDGVARYLGIPFAAPPFGDDRFALPRPHAPWDGVFDADQLGPTSPQVPYAGGLEKVLPSISIPGDEILNLNIWAPLAPAPATERGHPVMVWFHGGALTRGGNAIPMYDGTAFARDGVVLVAPNYRLGAEGFAVLPDAPANLGLADHLAALRWVQAEIAKFGGDPRRVTIFGQSSGGGTVAALLALPAAGDLFSRAIIQSGPVGPRAPDAKTGVTELIAADLGVERTRAGFAAVPPARLVAAQARVMSRGNSLAGGPGFAGVVGDELMPVDPWESLSSGTGARVPVIVGYTAEEFRLWLAPSGRMRSITWLHLLLAMIRFRIRPRVIGLYRRRRPRPSAAEILEQLVTDLLVRVPVNRFADMRHRHGGTTFVYELTWRSPAEDIGAAHGLDVPFVFDNLSTADAKLIAGADPPQPLADRMHGAWVDFATTGDPGWSAWDGSRPVMVFDHPGGGVQHAPRERERSALDALRALRPPRTRRRS